MNTLSKEQLENIKNSLAQISNGESQENQQLIQLLARNFTIYVGVDVDKEKISLATKNAVGDVLSPSISLANEQSGFEKFSSYVLELATKFNFTTIMVGMEATGIYYKRFKNFLESSTHFKVFVYNPKQAYHLARAKLEYKKTDPIDAGTICDLMRIGKFPAGKTPMTPENESLLKLVLEKYNHTTIQAEEKTHLKEDLEQVSKSLLKVFKQGLIFGKGPLALLELYPLPEDRLSQKEKELIQLISHASQGDYGEEEVRKILEEDRKIKISLDPILKEAFRTTIRLHIREIKHHRRIVEDILSPQISQIVDTSPLLPCISSIKGVGKNTAPVFIAFSDIIRGYPIAERFAGFCGLTPCEKKSGKSQGHAHISKAGPPILRWALFLVADCIRKYDPKLKDLYQRIKEKHKPQGKKIAHLIAVCAVAREVATLIWAVVKFQRPYFLKQEDYKEFVASLPKEHPLIKELARRKLERKIKKQMKKFRLKTA